MIQERCWWERHLSPSCAYVTNTFEPEINLKQVNTIFIFNYIFFSKQAVSVSVFELFIKNRIWKECVFQGIRRLRERSELNISLFFIYLQLWACVSAWVEGAKAISRLKSDTKPKMQHCKQQTSKNTGQEAGTLWQLCSTDQECSILIITLCKSSPCWVSDI